MSDSRQLIEDLMTLIDAVDCYAMIGAGDFEHHSTALSAVWDAHNVSHVLQGEDDTRSADSLRVTLSWDPAVWFIDWRIQRWADTVVRLRDVVARYDAIIAARTRRPEYAFPFKEA